MIGRPVVRTAPKPDGEPGRQRAQNATWRGSFDLLVGGREQQRRHLKPSIRAVTRPTVPIRGGGTGMNREA
jgi:hypothetical protein